MVKFYTDEAVGLSRRVLCCPMLGCVERLHLVLVNVKLELFERRRSRVLSLAISTFPVPGDWYSGLDLDVLGNCSLGWGREYIPVPSRFEGFGHNLRRQSRSPKLVEGAAACNRLGLFTQMQRALWDWIGVMG